VGFAGSRVGCKVDPCRLFVLDTVLTGRREIGRMEFGILGPLRVARGGADIDLGPFKQRALLALLVLQVGRVVSTDRILEELWGDDAAGKEQALWVYVSRLRSALEPERSGRGASGVLQTRDHGYVLAVDPAGVDAVRAEQLVEDARRQALDAPGTAAAAFAAALELWRGDALEDFAYQDFAQGPMARLGELRTTAAEDRYDALLRAGEHAVVVGRRSWTAPSPCRTRHWPDRASCQAPR
jgi:DNA-binding SARP family transcriptional activator